MTAEHQAAAQGFSDTRVAKLRKRIHLPADLSAEVHEERHLSTRYSGDNSIEVNPLNNWKRNYTRSTGWTVVYMQPAQAIMQAQTVEVILRRHKVLGNFILFRVWKS